MTASSASHAFPGPRPLKRTLLSAFAHAKYCTMDVAAVLHRYTKRPSIAGRRMGGRSEAEAEGWHPLSGSDSDAGTAGPDSECSCETG